MIRLVCDPRDCYIAMSRVLIHSSTLQFNLNRHYTRIKLMILCRNQLDVLGLLGALELLTLLT